ncbi:TIM barrel protein [Candidatus Pacearchaeota archaeon]|nr:TIM barrel protein [Candidatus Pacearchaeota archaeon]
MIKIGIAGVSEQEIPELVLNNIFAGEVEFVRQIYLTNEKAKILGQAANWKNFDLSIHAPYYINLNSDKKEIIQASIQRILTCCERAHHMSAKNVVFHPGYYGKISKLETYENIKQRILEMKDVNKDKKWNVKLCPETMGKINVFGSWEETKELVKQTGCGFCMDFAHMKARNFGDIDFEDYVKELKEYEHVHCHYSGIEWNKGGEKKHLVIDFKEALKLFALLKEYKINCTIINESADPFGDAVKLAKLI